MLKFFASKYYWLLAIMLLYFIFTITVKWTLIDWIYNIDPYESIKDGDAYRNANRLNGVFAYCFWGYLSFINLLSVIMIFVPEGKRLSRWILILTPVVSFLLFFSVLVTGGFNQGWY